jgi:hypothetical protein
MKKKDAEENDNLSWARSRRLLHAAHQGPQQRIRPNGETMDMQRAGAWSRPDDALDEHDHRTATSAQNTHSTDSWSGK